jgi:hypothetical protein
MFYWHFFFGGSQPAVAGDNVASSYSVIGRIGALKVANKRRAFLGESSVGWKPQQSSSAASCALVKLCFTAMLLQPVFSSNALHLANQVAKLCLRQR